ncbi:MAG: acetyl-CoA carboxylase biotin carboxyl carrier protein subunit [Blastocatellia bacterium]|nr:acetyl-CoA carboxylase biotin carboxyl carrier protein subunit [Blastocatellia bacterium]MBL8193564.1 acetyl-CoA carboxylase biotin carboxyl carrier protein subunit [Blastocatellia bacterium]MBN8723561.1 acetyl-CoA carboxylase biotin carboxyl carrier protein subunit [Acidobacteriota bacterium]
MKLEIEIANKIVVVDWHEKDQKIFANIDGTNYEVQVSKPNNNTYTLLVDNQVYELRVNASNHSEISIGDQVINSKVVDHRKQHQKSDAALAGIQAITAPMPGRVVQVLKNVGDEVKSGEGIVVVEAMKMQNELGAPKTGIVKAIKVKVGQTVVASEVLAIVE